ncbi:MAG: hypothetical protein ACODAC_05070 [Pseudomonadota bacterium]
MKATDGPREYGGGVELRQTLLLPHLFEGIDEGQRLTVLDVGAGVPETVAFFSGFRCRIHFADLFEAPDLREWPEEEPERHFAHLFGELCHYADDTRFDVCLLWDFLNHLPPAGVRAFSAALAPYLHAGTVGHGFGAFKASAPALSRGGANPALQYGIHDVGQLAVRPRPDGVPAGYSHSRTTLAEDFTCLEIVRGTLLREGAMELLFHAR